MKIFYRDGKGKVSSMCEVAERLEQMGIEKGRLGGEQMTVYSFVKDKTITPEQGAHKLNISVAELEKKDERSRIYLSGIF